MEKENRAAKIGEFLFYIALVIEIGVVIVDKSALINPIEGRLFQLTFLLCAVKIAMTKYTLKEWVLMALFVILGLITDHFTERNEIIRLVAFIAASKNINVKTVLKVTFYVTLAGVLSLIALSLMGILGQIYVEADFRETGIERRYCLGLGHPNALHCMAWALTTLAIYLYMHKMRWFHYLCLMMLHLGLFLLTDSRSGLAGAFITIGLGFLFYLFPKLKVNKWTYVLGITGYLCGVVFSIIIARYGVRDDFTMPALFEWMDKYLTGRLRWSCFHGGTQYWSLFSCPDNIFYFDMGYIRMFFWYGIIPASIFIIVRVLQLVDIWRKKDAGAFLVVVSFCIYTVFEAHAVSVYIARDYALLLMVGIWAQILFLHGGNEGYFWQVKKIFTKQEKICEK